MSEFVPNRKVRCADCSNLNNNRCAVKDTVVAARKRRSCGQYKFSGTLANRVAPPSIYIPAIDKKTRHAIRKLIEAGVLAGTTGDIQITREGKILERQTLEIPQNTATASVLGTVPLSAPVEANLPQQEGSVLRVSDNADDHRG